jgi:two-component system sensor histidine kinase ChvG
MPSQPLRVAVPPSTIEAVVGNLIENSRQAGAHHCAIEVSRDEAVVQIVVADDGPGISPADRERLFEPFFTTRRATGGTGLGLSIARSLLDACGGTIALADTLAGCTIVIVVPAGA